MHFVYLKHVGELGMILSFHYRRKKVQLKSNPYKTVSTCMQQQEKQPPERKSTSPMLATDPGDP
jgi:hypothetical protein